MIDAAAIMEAARPYFGWGYAAGLTNAEQDRAEKIDCSSLTARILRECAPTWDAAAYGDLVIYADRVPARPWAPIEAATRLGWGVRVALHDLPAGAVALVQEWRELPKGGPTPSPGRGHAFLVWGATAAGRVHILEATPPGVTWRHYGPAGQRTQVAAALGLVCTRGRCRPYEGHTWPIAALHTHRAALIAPAVSGVTPAPVRPAPVATPGTAPVSPEKMEGPLPRRLRSAVRPSVLHRLQARGYDTSRISRIVDDEPRDRASALDKIRAWLGETVDLTEILALFEVSREILRDGRVTPNEARELGLALLDILDRD